MNAEIDALNRFIGNLVSATANATLYSPGHAQVAKLCSAALENFRNALGSKKEITLMLMDQALIFEGQRLRGPLFLQRFAALLRRQGIGHIGFGAHLTEREIESFVAILANRRRPGEDLRSIADIQTGTLEIRIQDQPHTLGAGPVPSLAEIPDAELGKFNEIFEQVKKKRHLSMTGVFELVAGFVEAFQDESQTLLAFAPLRIMDEYAFTHSSNVCLLNLAQAASLGIEGALMHDIGIAGLLHDIGKLFIPEEILNKPGELSVEEWQIMQEHPVLGARHLLQTPGVPRLAVLAAFEHHLKFNLSGYPRVCGDWRVHLCSHITAVSDTFDALRSRRVYSGSESLDQVLGIMLEASGTDLHPVLTGNFLSLRERLPGPASACTGTKGEDIALCTKPDAEPDD